jgi:hypothetical protein
MSMWPGAERAAWFASLALSLPFVADDLLDTGRSRGAFWMRCGSAHPTRGGRAPEARAAAVHPNCHPQVNWRRLTSEGQRKGAVHQGDAESGPVKHGGLGGMGFGRTFALNAG